MMSNQKETLRDNLSIGFCQNLMVRLDSSQDSQTKINTIIAIKNLITETNIYDPIIYDPLISALSDEDKNVKDLATKVINLVMCDEIKDLLKIKFNVADSKTKRIIEKLL